MDNLLLEEVTQQQISDDLIKDINPNSKPNIVQRPKSIQDKSEETYLDIVQEVVRNSKENLEMIHTEKSELRCRLIDFCLQILAFQLIFLILFLVFSKQINLSDKVLSVYMTAVFVETLGAAIVMIKYAFKSDEEVKIIDILNAVVKNFQKYKDEKDNEQQK